MKFFDKSPDTLMDTVPSADVNDIERDRIRTEVIRDIDKEFEDFPELYESGFTIGSSRSGLDLASSYTPMETMTTILDGYPVTFKIGFLLGVNDQMEQHNQYALVAQNGWGRKDV